MQDTVLVIDVGSTRLKAALYAADGFPVASHHADSPLSAATVDASDVLEAVIVAAHAICANHRPGAIAVTGATRTHVLSAADGTLLGDVVKLDDARGAAYENEIKRAYGEPGAKGLGAFHPVARLLEFRNVQPARYAAARWQLELKDWINFQLTGIVATDQVAYDRLKPKHRSLNEMCMHLGLRTDLFSPPMPPGRIVGRLRGRIDARLAHLHDVPVVQCGFDAWCASYGMGCVQENHVYNVSGTTEVFGSFSAVDQALPGVGSLRWSPELFHLGGPCLTGLSTLAWFGQRFLDNSDPQGVLDCAALATDDCPLCLPFVSGERMPFWRADLSAQFLDVRSHHGLPEFARSLVDGLMAFQRYLVTMLCPNAITVHLGGGAAALRGWSELKASMFAKPVSLCDIAEPGLLGGAMSAWAAMGRCESVASAQMALRPTYRLVQPDAVAARRIQVAERRLLPRFQQLHAGPGDP